MKRTKTSITSDILGALAGTAVVLPQSMGLGVVLFSVMGLDASSGALAGIIGAAVLSIISGLFGATLGMFSAPNGPVTMLLVGLFSTMAADAVAPQSMLLALSVILVLTGIFQIIFSLLGGAKLVKYIPYPVVVGLVTGIGFLMIKSQIKFVTDSIPLLVALITIVTIVLTSRYMKKIPATLMGLIVGGVSYQLINYFYLHGSHDDWVVGIVPGIDALHFGFSFDALKSLQIKTIVTASLALTVLATTDCLVTAIVADSQTNTRHNGRKEIIAQGVGQIIVGLLGGLGGGGTKGATLVNLQSGGGRYSAVFSGMSFILLMLFFGGLGAYLPISVLSGVVAYVGFGMINFNIINWMKYNKSRSDAVIALIVVATIIFIDLVTAVGVGVIISMLMYIRMQIKAPIIHRQTDATRKHSLVKRTAKESEILATHGEQIVMFELRGNLFFATADKLLETLDPYVKKDYCIILHFQRVQLVDISGVILLLQIARNLKNVGGELILCHMHKELGLGKKINSAFEKIDKQKDIKILTFVNTDTAFRYAENKLLHKYDISLRDRDVYMEVKENNFCKNMPENIVKILEEVATKRVLQKGELLFEQDSKGESLFMVLQGDIDVRLYTSKNSYTTLARYGAGTYFGEIAFLNPGKRVASAIASNESILLELSRDTVMLLKSEDREELALVLLFELGSTLGNELRHSAAEIRRLEAT